MANTIAYSYRYLLWLGEPKRTNRLMFTAMLAMILLNLVVGERIPIHKGLGFDGRIYAGITRKFPTVVVNRGISEYHLQRALPSIFVAIGLHLFRCPMTDINIIRGFQILACLMLLLSVCLWGKIADYLHITMKGKWFGFFALFINFHVAKFLFYYPVLTDASGLALTLLMFYFYIRNRLFLLWCVGLIGSFVFPTLRLCAIPMLLFPPGSLRESEPSGKWIIGLSSLSAAAVMAAIIWARTKMPGPPTIIFLIGEICAVVYIYFAVRPVISVCLRYKSGVLKRTDGMIRVILVLLLFFVVGIVVHVLRSSEAFSLAPKQLVKVVGALCVSKPLIFLVAHLINFGPLLLACLLSWKACVSTTLSKVPGMSVILMMGIFLSLDSESRHIEGLYAMLVPFGVMYVESLRFRRGFYIWFGLVSLVMTKLWLSINAGCTTNNLGHVVLGQRYFCNQGPWMSKEAYILQGLVLVVILLWLHLRFLRPHILSARKMG